MNSRLTTAVMLAGYFLLAGCSDQDTAEATAPKPVANAAATPTVAAPATVASTAPATQAADPHAGVPMPAAARQVAASNEGTVTAVRTAGGYTYLEVERSGQRLWLASTRVEARPGQVVRWGDAAVMRNFYSKALGHTFERVLFVSQVLVPTAAAAVAPAPALRGRVVSVTDGAGYSFIEVTTESGSSWLAAPQQPVKSGDLVSWRGGATMRNFASKSLNRTFAEIVFVDGVTVAN